MPIPLTSTVKFFAALLLSSSLHTLDQVCSPAPCFSSIADDQSCDYAPYGKTQWGMQDLQATPREVLSQCDEARPNCDRCIKSNRICPGYVEGLDLVLRDQNEVAKVSVGRRQKAAQKARLASETLESRSISSPFASSSSSSFSSSERASGLIVRPTYLAPSEDEYQLCLFVDAWVLYPHDAQADRGFIELLPFMYSSAKLDSPLALCVAAISSALSAKFILKIRNVEIAKVRQKYTKALTTTRQALQDPVESLTDGTLMAVCLLGYYEECIESFRAKISSPRHFDGAAALIDQRQGRVSTEIGQKLLVGVRNSIIYRALIHGTPIDTSSSIWQDIDSVPHNVATLLDHMSLEISNLLVSVHAKRVKNQGCSDLTSLPDIKNEKKANIIAKALAIDANLSTWPDVTPPSWAPVRLSAKDIPRSITTTDGVYQDYCHLYEDMMVCSTWNSYRLSRLKVLAIIIHLSSCDSSEFIIAIEKLQALADDICASVPFCMGSRLRPVPLYSKEADYPTTDGRPAKEYHYRTAAAFGGWHLLSPMKEVMKVGMWLRPAQLAWMGAQLDRLARVYDIEPEED